MAQARSLADQLEAGIDEEYWPFPTYAELLFSE
jgi:glutamine synthetase